MRGWTDPGYASVAQLLEQRTGLRFGPASTEAAEAGTRRAMQKAGVTDVRIYDSMLRDGMVSLSDLVDEVTVCETFFFRQAHQFELIRRQILPDVRRRRAEDHVFRAWSAGCASGEEPYSLAILLEEEGLLDRSFILGTDISRVALAKARAARYDLWSLRGISETRVRRHFEREGYTEVVKPRIRDRVTFLEVNLLAKNLPPHLRGFDLILCRNVLIYFDAQTVRRVAERMRNALADGGWLITGGSDPLLPRELGFESVETSIGAAYRKRAITAEIVSARPPFGSARQWLLERFDEQWMRN